MLLGTGVIILPQRQALVIAKQLASLDVLSKGRLVFGLGVGWCEPEMRSVGASFAERGRIADEYLAAMRAVWTQAQAVLQGPRTWRSRACRRCRAPCRRRCRSSSAAARRRPSVAP